MGTELGDIIGNPKRANDKSDILTTVKRINSDKRINNTTNPMKSLNYAEEGSNLTNMKAVKKINQTLNQTNQMIEVTDGED